MIQKTLAFTVITLAMTECECGQEFTLCDQCTRGYCNDCNWEEPGCCTRCGASYCDECCSVNLDCCDKCNEQCCKQCFPVIPNFIWDEWDPVYGTWMPVCSSCVDVDLKIDESLYRRQSPPLLIKQRNGSSFNFGRRHDSRRAQFRRELC